MVDVSCPSHKSSEHSSNNRLLSLTITDGHTELLAVEYKHINALNMKLELGTKVACYMYSPPPPPPPPSVTKMGSS